MPKPDDDSDGLIDTLCLSDEQWQALSKKLDQIVPCETSRRTHKRVSYRKLAQIAVAIQMPDGKWAKYIVRSRDLSPGGIGFIHGAYIHVGSQCRVILKDREGKVVCLEGVVRHCDYLSGTAHDVGVQFDKPINLRPFLGAVAE